MYEGKTIEILEVKDIQNCRIVAFLSNSNPSYAKFIKNKDGNYKWQSVRESKNESFVMYIVTIFDKEKSFTKPLIITNENNSIAKMVVDVNGKNINKEFEVGKNTVTWFDLPDSNGSSYSFKNYKYYDINGTLLDKR